MHSWQKKIQIVKYIKHLVDGHLEEWAKGFKHKPLLLRGARQAFGAGRIRSLFMYPFSFDEFLQANGNTGLLNAINKACPENPHLYKYKLLNSLCYFFCKHEDVKAQRNNVIFYI